MGWWGNHDYPVEKRTLPGSEEISSPNQDYQPSCTMQPRTSPESRPKRTKHADTVITPCPLTCFSTVMSTHASSVDRVDCTNHMTESRCLHANSDLKKTHAMSEFFSDVNIPHFKHDDHQLASSEPCPATIFGDLLVSSSFLCTAAPLTSNDDDNNNSTILDYDKRIADS